MPLSPDTMRIMIIGCMLSMVILAAFYLRRRELSPLAYAAWGLLALVLPLIGPFIVIWLQPGGNRVN